MLRLAESSFQNKLNTLKAIQSEKIDLLSKAHLVDAFRSRGEVSRKRKRVYDIFEAEWRCDDERRFGSHVFNIGDGPKWVCGESLLNQVPDCLVYSIGSNWDFEFEYAVNKLAPQCHIHTFDGTLDFTSRELPEDLENKNIYFHHVNIMPECTSDSSLANPVLHGATLSSGESSQYPSACFDHIIRDLGHVGRTVSWLKIDCEGCEFAVMPTILSSQITIEQVFIEVHGVQFDNVLQLFKSFDKSGLIAFHKEINQWCDGHGKHLPMCVEYSFMSLKHARSVTYRTILGANRQTKFANEQIGDSRLTPDES